jgi:hypothetical protein
MVANSGQLPGTFTIYDSYEDFLDRGSANLSHAEFVASLELFQAEVAPVLRRTIPDPDWPEPVTVVRRRPARETAPA